MQCVFIFLMSILLVTSIPQTEPQLYFGCQLNPSGFEVKQLNNQRWTEVTAVVTYYTTSDDECGKHDGITASGTQATEGRTIAMSSDIPFGTKVVIDGHEYTVEDRGGAIVSNRIDVFCEDKTYALTQGRKVMTVKILDNL